MPRKTVRKGLSTFCPACGTDIYFRRLPRRGNYVTCHECESLLEVVRLAPLTLEWAFEEPLDDGFIISHDFEHGGKDSDFDDAEFEYVTADDDWDNDWDDDWDDDEMDGRNRR